MKYIELIIPNSQNIADKLNEHTEYELVSIIALAGFVKIIMVKTQKKGKQNA